MEVGAEGLNAKARRGKDARVEPVGRPGHKTHTHAQRDLTEGNEGNEEEESHVTPALFPTSAEKHGMVLDDFNDCIFRGFPANHIHHFQPD
jgi:hypothetical protein